MVRRRPVGGAAAPADHLIRSVTWQGLRSGDPVVVTGLRIRGAAWEFVAHVRNVRNGSESIEVVGGRPGARQVRSFGPDRIFAVSAKLGRSGELRSDQLSLADAPQLPFG
jgi:hypothetical protein